MSSLQRTLHGTPLAFDLVAEGVRVKEGELLRRNGRNARTLAKEDGLRITQVAVAAGGRIPSHSADGPISIQVLEGDLLVTTADASHRIRRGGLLTLPAGAPHEVASTDGGVFLLTVWSRLRRVG